MQKEKIANLLIVSGLGRNIGKTELAAQIIAQQSKLSQVFGIKVSVISPNPSSLVAHQQHTSYRIFEETNPASTKDTSRMLRSGAGKVYYLQAGSDGVRTAFEELLRLIPEDLPVVCESNSLGDFFSPGLHLLLAGPEHDLKQYAKRVDMVDHCIISDRRSGFSGLDTIQFENGGWFIRQSLRTKPLPEEQ